MRIISKSGEEIRSVDDWFAKAPPKQGARHWKDYRSAKELAKSWFRTPIPSPPEELAAFLQKSFPYCGVTLSDAYPECVVPLDHYGGEHRNADLVVLGTAGPQHLVISVEAKADEPFGDQLIGEYYDARRTVAASNVPARIAGLTRALFNTDLDPGIRLLRYQLLHATAAALIEAKNRQAEIALLLVHEFISDRLDPAKLACNHNDWQAFLGAVLKDPTRELPTDRAIGPVTVCGGEYVPSHIPLYLGKIQTSLSPQCTCSTDHKAIETTQDLPNRHKQVVVNR